MMIFKLHLTQRIWDTPISVLQLGTRTSNCMLRNGVRTVGDLVTKFPTMDRLATIRGLGDKSVDELVLALVNLQCSFMSDKEKTEYAKELYEINAPYAQ